MSNKRISFTIQKTGDVKINDLQGFGTGCQEATQDIEKMLGTVDENSRTTTQNYYVEVDPLTLNQNAG